MLIETVIGELPGLGRAEGERHVLAAVLDLLQHVEEFGLGRGHGEAEFGEDGLVVVEASEHRRDRHAIGRAVVAGPGRLGGLVEIVEARRARRAAGEIAVLDPVAVDVEGPAGDQVRARAAFDLALDGGVVFVGVDRREHDLDARDAKPRRPAGPGPARRRGPRCASFPRVSVTSSAKAVVARGPARAPVRAPLISFCLMRIRISPRSELCERAQTCPSDPASVPEACVRTIHRNTTYDNTILILHFWYYVVLMWIAIHEDR